MKLYGVYLAKVVASTDPTGRHRLQVSIPSLGIGPCWARVCNSLGSRVGGTAVVSFEAGDAANPIVLGFLS
ncbi:MAG: phage baseplate assembly protein V [Candidatus Acidiferrum sp.]